MATQENKPPVKRQFLFNPLKRPMPYIGLMLAILIVIFQGTLRVTIADLVGGWLVNNIKEGTEGQYTIDYDFVRFDVFTKELRIQNLNLELDTAVTNENTYLDKYSNLIDLSTPVVVLKLESLWDLIVNDKLKIVFIGLQEPRIHLIHSENISQEEVIENQQEASEKVRSYLRELEIDSFRVLNGTVDVYLQGSQRQQLVGFKIRDFSTLLRGFRLDEIRSDKPFQGIHAEVFELEVKDQHLSIPQLNHNLKFNRLWLSTIDSTVVLDTLDINPSITADSSLQARFNVQKIALEGMDFRKLYDSLILEIDRIDLDKPNLNFIGKELQTASDYFAGGVDLMSLKELVINKISLDSGSININLKHNIKSELFSFRLMNLQVDSIDFAQNNLIQNFNNFSFETYNSTIELPDSVHEVKIGYAKINSHDSIVLANNVRINPISSRRKYKIYRDRGTKFISYGTIRNVFLNGIDYNEVMNNQQLLADSLILVSPNLNITEYPYIRSKTSNSDITPFLIHNVIIAKGNMKYNRRQNNMNHRTELQGMNLDINNLYPEGKEVLYDNLDVTISSGLNELKAIGHTLRFKGLKSNNLTNVDISQVQLEPDSIFINGEKINLDLSGIRVRGLNLDDFSDTRKISINNLGVESLDFNGDFTIQRNNNTNINPLKTLEIYNLNLEDGNFTLTNNDNSISFEGVTAFTDSVIYESKPDTLNSTPINFHELLLTYDEFLFKSNDNKTSLSGKQGSFSESDSLISASDIGLNLGGTTGTLDNIVLRGLDRHALLSKEGLKFEYLLLDKPGFTIGGQDGSKTKSNFEFNTDSIKSLLLNNYSYIEFDSILATNADLLLISSDRTTHLNDINTTIKEYRFDSTTTAQEILNPKELEITIAKVSSVSTYDSIEAQRVTLDMVANSLNTGNIHASVKQNKSTILANIPSLRINGFNSVKMLKNDFSLDTVLVPYANLNINSIDTTLVTTQEVEIKNLIDEAISNLFRKSDELQYDTIYKEPNSIHPTDSTPENRGLGLKKILDRITTVKGRQSPTPDPVVHEDSIIIVTLHKKAIPTNGVINKIKLDRAILNWTKNSEPQKFASDINFSIAADGLVLDSINKFNVFNHMSDLRIKLYDYMYKFPDSLNIISLDSMDLSTQKETIKVSGISLTPRVNKYDYANEVGHEVSWQHLHDLDIKIEKVDLQQLITKQEIRFGKITTYNGVFDIFRDKELDIPVNQYRPMPQIALKKLKVPVIIDSVKINNFRVNYSSRLSSVEPEGFLEIHEINGVVSNIVNTDSAIMRNPYTLVSANAKFMGKGLLTANFNFDMLDENQRFIFDAHLTDMDANEFNSLLEATAYVKVSSGKVKDLKMEAQGDEFYATGNMRFEYSDLKVATVSRKNLKTKGMGNVIKSFFANSFVVKKNNPSVRFFPREGAMYYERNTQKIIIDYATKTALSGIVSSIGGRNARKDIKRIQKEDKKKKDEERKAAKKAARRISGT